MATVEAVALEHAAVIHALPPDGVAVFPADDAYAGIWRVAATGNRILDFALHDAERQSEQRAACTAANSRSTRPRAPSRCGCVRSASTTRATRWPPRRRRWRRRRAVGNQAGSRIVRTGQGPAAGETGDRRQPRGATVVDDTYNANPDSMRAAIDVLAAQPAPRVLVIGDMGEVGDEGPAFHREVGAYARERGIDAVRARRRVARCLHRVRRHGPPFRRRRRAGRRIARGGLRRAGDAAREGRGT